MKQHAVPENIMDVEFKLFGSLTAKQFGYIIAGGGIALFFYYFFKSLNATFLGWIFVILSVILGLSLALIRINEQPFEVWLGNFLSAMFSSQKRVWRKSKNVPKALDNKHPVGTLPVQNLSGSTSQMQTTKPSVKINTQKVQTKPVPQVPTKQPSSIKTSGNTPSIPQHPFKDISAKKDEDKKEHDTIIDKTDEDKVQVAGKSVKEDGFYVPGSAQGFVKTSGNQVPNRPMTIQASMNAKQQVSHKPPIQSDSSVVPYNVPEPKDEQKDTNLDSGGVNEQSPGLQDIQGTNDTGGNGKVQVPPSGIITSDQKQTTPTTQSPYSNKAQIYSDIIPEKGELPHDSTLQGERVGDGVKLKPEDNLEEENKALRQKMVGYSEEKTQLEQELARAKEMQKKLKEQNEQIASQLDKLKKGTPAPSLESVGQVQKSQLPNLPTQPVGKVTESSDMEVLSPKVYNGPSLSKKPNVISGIVRTSDDKLLPGVVVIVKSEKGRPVRAIKTNSLGQFVTTTALEDGTYTIELSRNEYSFGVYEIRLTGEVLPTYEFIAE